MIINKHRLTILNIPFFTVFRKINRLQQQLLYSIDTLLIISCACISRLAVICQRPIKRPKQTMAFNENVNINSIIFDILQDFYIPCDIIKCFYCFPFVVCSLLFLVKIKRFATTYNKLTIAWLYGYNASLPENLQ